MIRTRMNLMLMAALGAALSVGGAAVAAAAPEFPDDGKIRVCNRVTGQVNEFDTIEQLDNFGANVEDRADWDLVKPLGIHIEVDLNELRADLDKLNAAHDDAARTQADTSAAPAGEPATLTDVVETAPAGTEQPAA